MTNDTNLIEPPVCFSMDLANAPTLVRFCYEAAAVLDLEINDEDRAILDAYEAGDLETGEFAGEVGEDLESALFSAGYYVRWDAGDVVVWDLRTLSDEDRDAFYEQMENV